MSFVCENFFIGLSLNILLINENRKLTIYSLSTLVIFGKCASKCGNQSVLQYKTMIGYEI